MGLLRGFHSPDRRLNGRKQANHSPVLDRLFWIARTSALWRGPPQKFGRWWSVYRQFRHRFFAVLCDGIVDEVNYAGIAQAAGCDCDLELQAEPRTRGHRLVSRTAPAMGCTVKEQLRRQMKILRHRDCKNTPVTHFASASCSQTRDCG